MVSSEDLAQLFLSRTPDEWSALLRSIVHREGFSHMLFGLLPNKTAQVENSFLVSNYSSRWRRTYEDLKLHNVDPTFSHSLKSTVPIIWKPEIYTSRPQKEFHEEARSYGLGSGVSFPLHGAHGEFGIFSLVASGTDHAAFLARPEQQAMLALLRDYVLESATRFLPDAKNTNTKLTHREVECLKWVMAGKSSWEIAKILRRSEATINFHIANVKRKFGVSTRQQAVVKGIKESIISPG